MRSILWISFWIVLLTGPLALEGLYRGSIHRQARAIQDGILRYHPDWRSSPPTFRRFNQDSKRLEASLFRDLHAWVTRKAGWRSDLEDGAPYLSIWYDCGRDRETRYHPFLWSPRLRRFVPTRLTSCDRPGCPYQPE